MIYLLLIVPVLLTLLAAWLFWEDTQGKDLADMGMGILVVLIDLVAYIVAVAVIYALGGK